MPSKPWYTSRTLWLSILEIVGSVCLYVYALAMNDVTLQHVAQAAFLLALTHFGLRIDTTQPIS